MARKASSEREYVIYTHIELSCPLCAGEVTNLTILPYLPKWSFRLNNSISAKRDGRPLTNTRLRWTTLAERENKSFKDSFNVKYTEDLPNVFDFQLSLVFYGILLIFYRVLLVEF